MSDVQLVGPVRSLRFDETPRESAAAYSLLDSRWEECAKDQPALFNGPILACRACEPSHGGYIEIAWYETNYAHYLQRVTSAPLVTPARAIFCSVALRPNSGRLLVGQMSNNTSSPGRLQLPGGNVTRGRSGALSSESCAEDACREFEEEVGLMLQPSLLDLWRVKVGGRFDDLGLIYMCNLDMSEHEICAAFEKHVRAERLAGSSPEFQTLMFIDASFLDQGSTYNWVDYLPSVARLLAQPPMRRRNS
jgi:8-oxo-dGTP pyrophosphatase MutT (NUDIX family)